MAGFGVGGADAVDDAGCVYPGVQTRDASALVWIGGGRSGVCASHLCWLGGVQFFCGVCESRAYAGA
mgnify:CR=1 FL=1